MIYIPLLLPNDRKAIPWLLFPIVRDSETASALMEESVAEMGNHYQMFEAAGIHLIIATQRPEARIVTPIIRSNLPGRVALATASEADSRIILGGTSTEAAYLLGQGDLFL